jgi:hypothetical protein
MSDANSGQEILCPYCGAKNSIGVFCAECGKRIRDDNPKAKETALPYLPPPTKKPQTAPSVIARNHSARNIVIVVLIAVIALSLVAGTLIYTSRFTIGNNPKQASNSPTPQITLPPQSTPTTFLTPTPTISAPTVAQSIEITGINLQIQYGGLDQGYFGADSQFIAISNQPNQILTVNQGSQFFLYFTLTESSKAATGDIITSIAVRTSGFINASVQPPVPIDFSPGGSQQITITLTAPQSSFNGPGQLILSTSGGTPAETQGQQ